MHSDAAGSGECLSFAGKRAHVFNDDARRKDDATPGFWLPGDDDKRSGVYLSAAPAGSNFFPIHATFLFYSSLRIADRVNPAKLFYIKHPAVVRYFQRLNGHLIKRPAIKGE